MYPNILCRTLRRPHLKLAQKHRPVTFDDVIGQDPVVAVLKAIVAKERYESAYMFSGPSGDGKTTLGRILAMAMLCKARVGGNPCCTCESCTLFLKEQHYGFRELDAASFGGKDDMVKLRDEAAFVSSDSRKIILLDECHDISRQGQDALLKQVEQCPEHLVYLFCTTDPDKMNQTLRNRCTEFHITRVDPAKITARLRSICESEGLQADDEALRAMAAASKGHVRNAVNLLEEASLLGPVTAASLGTVFRDHDPEIFGIVSNLGIDLPAALKSYSSVASYLSPMDLYDRIISLVDDACRLLYGYEGDLTPARRGVVSRLKDIHGFNLLEFLNYLLARDKFVDRMGMQSDIIVLHYKFSSGSMQPHAQPVLSRPQPQTTVQQTQAPQKQAQAESSAPSYAQLSKMPVRERSRVLCDLRASRKPVGRPNETAEVPAQWPLLKDDRPGESSFDDDVLSPQEFSQNLVGGRKSGI